MIIRGARERQDFMLREPVKRRRAMVATNPSRNSRSELIDNDGKGVPLPSRLIARPGPDQREAVLRPERITAPSDR